MLQGFEANNGQWIMIGNTITRLIYGIIILESTVLGEIYAPTIASNNVIKNCRFVGIDLIDATRHTLINGNICFDDQTTHTQTRGIFTQGVSDNYIITNNICFGNTNSQVSDTASGTNK